MFGCCLASGRSTTRLGSCAPSWSTCAETKAATGPWWPATPNVHPTTLPHPVFPPPPAPCGWPCRTCPPNQRDALALRFYADAPTDEIADTVARDQDVRSRIGDVITKVVLPQIVGDETLDVGRRCVRRARERERDGGDLGDSRRRCGVGHDLDGDIGEVGDTGIGHDSGRAGSAVQAFIDPS